MPTFNHNCVNVCEHRTLGVWKACMGRKEWGTVAYDSFGLEDSSLNLS